MAMHRIEVRATLGGADPRGEDALLKAQSAGIKKLPTSIETSAVYLIDGDLDEPSMKRITGELLCDAVTEISSQGTSEPYAQSVIEVHPLPGVMDPCASAVELAIHRLLGKDVSVQTGWRYDFHGIETADAQDLVRRCLANEIVTKIHTAPFFSK